MPPGACEPAVLDSDESGVQWTSLKAYVVGNIHALTANPGPGVDGQYSPRPIVPRSISGREWNQQARHGMRLR
jgi:hypothetical protein